MPDFIITSPDGQKFKVSAPEGATADDALAYVQAQHQGAPATTEAPPATSEAPPASTGAPPMKPSLTGAYKRTLGDAAEWEKGLSLSGVMRGLTDLRDAGSQLIGRGHLMRNSLWQVIM